MKLDFNEITVVPKPYTLANEGWFDWPGTVEKRPVTAEFSVVKEDSDTVRFEGRLTGSYIASCDRCGVDVAIDLTSEFSYLVTTRVEDISELSEVECDFEDLMTVYVEEPVVDVMVLLSEQAELALPMQMLCGEDCKGLCAGCGVILNSENCKCDPDITDSPFAVLRKLSQR